MATRRPRRADAGHAAPAAHRAAAHPAPPDGCVPECLSAALPCCVTAHAVACLCPVTSHPTGRLLPWPHTEQRAACRSRTTRWSTWTSRARRPHQASCWYPILRNVVHVPRSLPAQAAWLSDCQTDSTLPTLLCHIPAGGGAFAEQTAWPEFHNGVAAGLRLAPGAHQLTRTWVVYNKPPGGRRWLHGVVRRVAYVSPLGTAHYRPASACGYGLAA